MWHTLAKSMDGSPPAPKNTFKKAMGKASMESSWKAGSACQSQFPKLVCHLAVEVDGLLPIGLRASGSTIRVLAPITIARESINVS